MEPWVWIPVVVVALGVVWAIATYNRLVQRRNRVDNSWGQIEVQLNRRHDLVPNLVETVKGYAAHEQSTFEAVVAARNAAMAASGPNELADAENVLTGALRQLFALAEAYPQLRASEGFNTLQSQLARQIYNDTVLTYNNTVQSVPTNIVAGIGGFSAREFYDAPPAAGEAPRVSF
jgi:LemA protein